MAHLIDKDAIVAEIKRRKELVSDPILLGNDLMIGEGNAYFNLLSFIDSMQEEPTIPDIVDEHWWEMLGEEPVSEDLEEVAHRYYKPNDTFMDGFKAGAKWQKGKISEENILLPVKKYNKLMDSINKKEQDSAQSKD